jgi:vesicle coat complex subunit
LDAKEHLPTLRASFELDADPYVQAAAAAALGQLCDSSSADALTEQAKKLLVFGPTERDGIVGTASLVALGRLHPKDLDARLAPFFQPDVPRFVQGAARSAQQQQRRCAAAAQ